MKTACEQEVCKHNVSDIGTQIIRNYLTQLHPSLVPKTKKEFGAAIIKVVYRSKSIF